MMRYALVLATIEASNELNFQSTIPGGITMANPITSTATTLEKQVIEVAQALEAAERTYNALPSTLNQVNNVSVALDQEGRTISVTISLPATVTATAGVVSMTPDAYLP
jgi:hypothetical protein